MKVHTKIKNGQPAVETDLTINWEGMTPEDERALAQQALIVKWQAGKRKDGAIPSAETVDAVDYKVGVRKPRTTLTLEQQVASLTPEQKQALLAKLMA